jgi:spore maturation protein A
MNGIFFIIIILSAIILSIKGGDAFLSSMIEGCKNALYSCVSLFCVYTIWMGLSAVAEDSGLNRRAAEKILPLTKKLFKTCDDEACKDISLNLTCNLLGLGGAATPYGVKAIERLEKEKNTFAQNLLFIINSTSIQVIPTTVISLRAAEGSLNPSDIILPSLLATFLSTFIAAGAYIIICKLKKR